MNTHFESRYETGVGLRKVLVLALRKSESFKRFIKGNRGGKIQKNV